MHLYDINIRKTDGRNEVHRRSYECGHKPASKYLKFIALAYSIKEAVDKAVYMRDGWPVADSCYFCFNYELRQA